MNLKYYLRGLGLGIVITAIIMGIAASSKKTALSDEDIIIKAKNLGMIEESELADYVQKAKSAFEQEVRSEIEAEYEKNAELQAADSLMTDAPQESQTSESGISKDGNEDEPNEPGEDTEAMGMQAEPIVFTVRKGETPYSISERLESSGLVTAATDFDKYLVDNGYDRKIVASEYMIPPDADMDMIARIITGHKITE